MSRQHWVLIWFALLCGKVKQCTMICDYDHIPVSRGCMRVQYPLLMAPTNYARVVTIQGHEQRMPSAHIPL